MNDEREQVKEVSQYIDQDFSKTGIEPLKSVKQFQNFEEFKIYLTDKIKKLMDNNFEKLLNTLYLIDINEEKVSVLFSNKNREAIPGKLAELIIERQIQKYYLRQKYKRGEL